jgi:hypothetical protein
MCSRRVKQCDLTFKMLPHSTLSSGYRETATEHCDLKRLMHALLMAVTRLCVLLGLAALAGQPVHRD